MHRPQSVPRPWIWFAGVGLIAFMLIQVYPILRGTGVQEGHTFSRHAAQRQALAVAAGKFGGANASDWGKPEITYLSDSAAAGYLAQTKLFDAYRAQWDADYPIDVYRADLRMPGDSGALTLFLHPVSGKLVGWNSRPAASGTAAAEPQAAPLAADPQQALEYAARWGEQPEAWIWDGHAPDARGTYTYLSRTGGVGETTLLLHVRMPQHVGAAAATPIVSDAEAAMSAWGGGAVTYTIQVPDDFAVYLAQQNKLAGTMNALGFVVPQLLMMIMAIVYAVTRRSYTSVRRGAALAALFWAMYAAFYFNLMPGFRSGLLEDGAKIDPAATQSLLVANLVIVAIMALFTYLAAVGGDGLWKSMGRSLWPRWREPNYGNALMTGMKRGYLLALVLLGVQSVILVFLDQGIGMFQATDARQSSYNMTMPWLLPLLAWCAGISEEIQSRLFGIGLFRHWLISGTRRLLGRAPSSRSAAWLTALAMFPPGLIWAFGHVGYAVYPVYSRLIELAILAMLFGWFMLRFGFLAVLFAHVIFNSILMSVQLVADGLPGGLAAGLAGPFLPAVIACLIGWAHRLRNRQHGLRP